MRTIKLKCESDQGSFDQTIREVALEREDEINWYGKPTANPACPVLDWPKFAWTETKQNEGARKALSRSPSPGTNLNPTRRKIDATKP